jgi:hypothetical protein
MIGFIFLSLALAVLVQNQNSILQLLATPAALTIGLTAAAASLLAGYLKKLPVMVWHDAFASSCLLVWYGYWSPLFNDETPMFFYFPLYYVLLTTFVTLTLINRRHRFDRDSIAQLRYLDRISRLDINSLAALVLISLLLTEHYMLYPMAMTLFIIRHTIIVCLL